ncbi:MAG: potassium-transporting ATPase subunit [Paenibacillaceae bacterium]|jgi:K+-transporting ATPase ATPase C chain|nr:potassium-transporting ATPase subunit [Paenibacillaceae bacterium]
MKIINVTLRMSLLLMVLVLAYQLVVTGIAQTVAPDKADGSLIYNSNGEAIGSALIGQTFTSPEFFQGRVSSIEYNAASSGTPNYAPSNTDMLERTKEAIAKWHTDNPQVPLSELPLDLVTNSGSGLDPDISLAAAKVQIPRISGTTGIKADQLEQLVEAQAEAPDWGIFGEAHVNVLKLNLALWELKAK